jgi:hypothetical protein
MGGRPFRRKRGHGELDPRTSWRHRHGCVARSGGGGAFTQRAWDKKTGNSIAVSRFIGESTVDLGNVVTVIFPRGEVWGMSFLRRSLLLPGAAPQDTG